MMTNTISYYRRYLQLLKSKFGMGLSLNEEKLDELSDAAEQRYEDARREGLTVEQAQELAMEMLMKGLDEQETGEEQNG